MTKLRFMFALLSAAAIVSCGDEPAASVAAPPVATPKPRIAEVVAASDAGTTGESVQYLYNYNPVGKRDPFRSPIDEPKKTGELAAGDVGCPEPLCQFDLEQLTLVAVVSGDANPVAMLEDATRIGHIVRRNTKVGKQGGKVSQILRDCIEVTEFFLAPDGKKVPNRVNICVKKEDKVERTLDLFNNKVTE